MQRFVCKNSVTISHKIQTILRLLASQHKALYVLYQLMCFPHVLRFQPSLTLTYKPHVLAKLLKTDWKKCLFLQLHPKLLLTKVHPSPRRKYTFLYHIFYRLQEFDIYYFTNILVTIYCTEATLYSKQIGGSYLSSHIVTFF